MKLIRKSKMRSKLALMSFQRHHNDCHKCKKRNCMLMMLGHIQKEAYARYFLSYKYHQYRSEKYRLTLDTTNDNFT